MAKFKAVKTITPLALTAAQQRSERAKQAAQTRKANKLAEQQRLQQQRDARTELWEKQTKEKQYEIENVLEVWGTLDDYYEEYVNEFFVQHAEEMKDAIRTLLRRGVSATLILAAFENEYITSDFHFGVYGMTLNAEEILEEVLLEDEFLGSKQPTPELKQRMWELTDTTVHA